MHIPVLLREAVEHLDVRPGGVYLDGTLGGGSHTKALLVAAGPDARVIGIDRDCGALDRARANLGPLASQVSFIHGTFADMISLAHNAGFSDVDGVLLDLGFSSDQVDDASRGLSFITEGPLDMRLDLSQELTAAHVVNELSEHELADAIFKYGDESASRRIARAIVQSRETAPFRSTLQLAEVVARSKGGRHGGRIHPATQTFQAIRILVNDELGQARAGCESAMRLVKKGGRVAVISFHSGEDRIVKQCMTRHVGRDVSLPQGGSRWDGELPRAEWIVKKPVTAGEDEVSQNPRARSAKLRVVAVVSNDWKT